MAILKANSKTKVDARDGAAGGNPKKMLGIVIGVVLALAVGGASAWYFTSGSHPKKAEAPKLEQPEYVALESFTVNLQPENGEQFLQVQFTLQVANAEQAKLIKDNMAQVRNRVLLLLSSKHASEINTVEGKRQLATDIAGTLKTPFLEKGQPQQVTDVLFTAFIIQ
jgi:flagellar FliL protein